MLNHLTIFYEVSTPFPPFGVKTGDNMRNTFVMNKNRIPVNRMKFKMLAKITARSGYQSGIVNP